MKERMDALRVALDNEMKAYTFYFENAERTKNPVGKAMFKQIAAEEMEHYQRLKQLQENWKRANKSPDAVTLKVKRSIVKSLIREAAKNTQTRMKGDAEDLKAVRIAIEFEAKGLEHYTRLRDESTEQGEKEFFNLLASSEREHYMSLKDTEHYMIDPVTWCREKIGHFDRLQGDS